MKRLWVSWLTTIVLIIVITEASQNAHRCRFNQKCNDCSTFECIQDNLRFERFMMKNMNEDVDPCDNFYEYACGNFENVSSGSNPETFYTPFIDQYLELKRLVLRNLTVTKEDLDSLKSVISELGGWPVVTGPQWNETNFDLIEFVRKAESIGIDFYPVYEPFIGLSMRNKFFFSINIPKFPFQKKIKAYHNYMVNVAKFFGANETLAKIELNESIEFERQLHQSNDNHSISYELPPLRGPNGYYGITVKEAIKKWPNINWKNIVERVDYTNNSVVFIKNTDYITRLNRLVKETPKRVQANFVMWNTIQFLIPYVESTTLLNLTQKYGNSIDQKDCFKQLQSTLPEVLVSYYLWHYKIDDRMKLTVYELADKIKEKLINTVNTTSWLDIKVKDNIVEQLRFVEFIFGANDEMLDNEKFEKYLQGLKITSDDYLMNFLSMRSFSKKKELSEILKLEKLRDLTTIVRLSKHFMSIALNLPFFAKIIFNPVLMKDLSFNIHRPNFINYATLGADIAHELGHSVDNRYKDVDEYSKRKNNWGSSSNLKYREVEMCLIEQFNNYTFGTTNHKLNGELCLDENIADNIGIKIAYSTYQDWVKQHGSEPVYSDSPFSANQLFWLANANKYCESKSITDGSSLMNNYAPNDKRIIGTFSNSPEFAKDFNCPVGSKMNPVKKCNFF